jgi:hypothetical protein
VDTVTVQPVDTGINAVGRNSRFPLVALTAIYALSAVLPLPAADGRILHLPTVCPFYHATGLPCPGCGLTRAFVCLCHGHLAGAVHWHPLAPVIFAIGLLAWADHFSRVFRKRELFSIAPRTGNRLMWASLAVFAAFGVARALFFAATHTRF